MDAGEDAGRPFADLGKWLQERRDTARPRLTQHDLAQASGVSQRNIQRYEAGQNAPDGPSLLRLFSALSVEITPLPPKRMYGSVNAELASLRAELQAAVEAERALHEETHRLLAELGTSVHNLAAELAAFADVERARQQTHSRGGKR